MFIHLQLVEAITLYIDNPGEWVILTDRPHMYSFIYTNHLLVCYVCHCPHAVSPCVVPASCSIGLICFLSRWRKRRPEPGFSFVGLSFAFVGIYSWLGSFVLSLGCSYIWFLPRDAMHKRGLCRHAVSVCLSRSWIMSKRINISSKFFTIGLPHHSSFSVPNGMAIFRWEPL